jgi:hypothetical protein
MNYTLNRLHLEKALTTKQFRAIIIIRIGLMLGIAIYCSIVILLYFVYRPGAFSTQDILLMDLLATGNAVFTVIMAGIAIYLSKLQFRPERLAGRADFQSPEEAAIFAVGLYRASSVMLMAPIEGAAFVGAVVCMVGVQNGTIEYYPMYWFNTASALLVIVIGLMTFPTRERILDKLEFSFARR